MVSPPARAGDWVLSRGPTMAGVSFEKDLPEKFDVAKGDNVIWKAPYPGRTTPVVLNGRVYMIQGYNKTGDKVMEQERVICLDEKDGKLLHEYTFNVFLTDIVSDRLGWTNLAADPETGNVYAHGTGGQLIAFDKDLKPLWQHSLTEEYGRVSGYGGRVVSPIVDEDKVIVGMAQGSWGDFARGGTRFVAFDKKTGEVVWWATTGAQVRDTYFSTPVVAVINGERLMVTGSGDGGVHAFKVRTGEKVWSYNLAAGSVNCTPIVDGTKVYIAHGEINPDNNEIGRIACLDAGQVANGKPKLDWEVDGLDIKFASPILRDGRLYVCDLKARMYCFDAKTGKPLWEKPYTYGRNSMGSPVWADGKIYVNPVQTNFVILEDAGDKAKLLYKASFPGQELNGSPTIVNGKIFFNTSNETYCIGKKDAKAQPAEVPPMPKETPSNGKAAKIAVFPADVVIGPGESVQLKVRVLDAQGRVLKEVKEATWKLGPSPVAPPLPGQPAPMPPDLKGSITEAGVLTVGKPPEAPPGQFGSVVAELDGMKATCRVRVAPALPYKPDFSKVLGAAPAGWVNTQGKFLLKEVGGKKVLAKNATVPNILVARATAYMGKPTLTDYTIQADVNGQEIPGNQADVGVVNQRYSLVLIGEEQKLHLMSWDALPRIDESKDFTYKSDHWYTMKLSVEQKGDKALVRGKVWQRGAKEPEAWDLTFEDPLPNKEGSPGLYGFATGVTETTPGAEAYYDNITVTPNK